MDRVIVMTVVPIGVVGFCLGFQWLLQQKRDSLWQRLLVPSWFRSPEHPSRASDWRMTMFHMALVRAFVCSQQVTDHPCDTSVLMWVFLRALLALPPCPPQYVSFLCLPAASSEIAKCYRYDR